mmetsp:Transcript_32041/g.75519  ORF Transcript_32041/g.75519 Transcript_32041/m.75519 type:complete len:172 (+) Transcript_32041:148-663(+)
MGTQQSRPGSTNLGRNEVGAWRHGVRKAHRVSNTVRKNRVPQFKVLSTVFEEEEESCEKRPAKYETLMRLLSEETERVRSYRSVGFRRRVEPQQVPSPQAQAPRISKNPARPRPSSALSMPRRKEDMYSKTHLAQKTAIIEQQRAAVEAVLRRAAEKKEQEANMSEQEQDQ